MTEPAHLLPWDSEHFGLKIARADASPEDAIAWAKAQEIDCMYACIEDDVLAWDEHIKAGFKLVDVRITLERSLDARSTPHPTLRDATEADLADLALIARTSHTDSRFYADARFDRARCDALYARWITNSVQGWADKVIVSELDGRLGGYISAHMKDDGLSSIGLLAVAQHARGQGLASAKILAACAWMRAQGATRCEVVTQGRNIAAQRVYQRAGFRTARIEYWFHWWRVTHQSKGADR